MIDFDNTPLFRVERKVLSAPEQFDDIVSGVNLRVDYLEKQCTPAQVEQFQSPGFAFDVGHLNFQAAVHGTIPPEWASICFVLNGKSVWRGLDGESGALFTVPPGEELDGNVSAGFSWLTAALSKENWRRCQLVAGAEGTALKFLSGWQLSPRQARNLIRRLNETRKLLQAAACKPEQKPLAFSAAGELVFELGTMVWELAAQDHGKATMRDRAVLARRANRWIKEHLGHAFQIADLCLALRVSRRELEYAFRATFDQSPHQFIASLRLNAIRRQLFHGPLETTVSRVAIEHGCSHFGRFSAQYAALFGELPSQTLKNRRGQFSIAPHGSY